MLYLVVDSDAVMLYLLVVMYWFLGVMLYLLVVMYWFLAVMLHLLVVMYWFLAVMLYLLVMTSDAVMLVVRSRLLVVCNYDQQWCGDEKWCCPPTSDVRLLVVCQAACRPGPGPRTCPLTREPAGPLRGRCGESDSGTLAFPNDSRIKFAMKGKSEVIIFIIIHGNNRGDGWPGEEQEGARGVRRMESQAVLAAHRLAHTSFSGN